MPQGATCSPLVHNQLAFMFKQQKLRKFHSGKKCSDNNCLNSVAKYNMLCDRCRRGWKFQSEEQITFTIGKDVSYRHFNKHLEFMKARKAIHV